MCKVLNKRTARPAANQVYIGRPSKWGNPFAIGVDGTRQKQRRSDKAFERRRINFCVFSLKETACV